MFGHFTTLRMKGLNSTLKFTIAFSPVRMENKPKHRFHVPCSPMMKYLQKSIFFSLAEVEIYYMKF